ncbi:calcium-binding protein [Nitrosomonas sp. Is37]|uniref:calcium-binding protein n=1 Tax=Nitrosomonas sp. Is37 TaxID=3080535 RepID=UPI00294AC6BA|nr:calcium-binding protein [Nitrosomonas sp. Is37]MDV6345076.1 calcium-binding protein [Nitrosomonas sp. Is37]
MTFHIAHIDQVYSNADGSVQFIKFVIDANDQEFWAGHSLTSSNGATTNTFHINTDLPSGATDGKSVLVATQGFADLGTARPDFFIPNFSFVKPDYIIPNKFLFTTNGTVIFTGMIGGTISYAQLPTDGKLSLSPDDSTGINSFTNFTGNTGTLPGNVIFGTEGPDNLAGAANDDIILALGGNDTLNGGAGNDTLNGGAGTDTAIYSSNRANYSVSGTVSNLNISGPDGNDTLLSIERFRFADKNIAIDLDTGEAAGNTVRIIGAAFGVPAIKQHPDYVGVGLNLFDSGQSVLEVSQLAVRVMGNPTDEVFVDTVFNNVVGRAPSLEEHNFYVNLLVDHGGTFTQAHLLEVAAGSGLDATSIDLVGLQKTGVEFV